MRRWRPRLRGARHGGHGPVNGRNSSRRRIPHALVGQLAADRTFHVDRPGDCGRMRLSGPVRMGRSFKGNLLFTNRCLNSHRVVAKIRIHSSRSNVSGSRTCRSARTVRHSCRKPRWSRRPHPAKPSQGGSDPAGERGDDRRAYELSPGSSPREIRFP